MSGEALHARVSVLLNTVIDPCSAAAEAPAGLVDMGPIRSLEVDERAEGAEVRVVVRVTHPSCMMAPLFLAQVQNLLHGLPAVAAVDATLDTGFDGTPADMSPGYRERLARHREAVGLGRGDDRGSTRSVGLDPSAPRARRADPRRGTAADRAQP